MSRVTFCPHHILDITEDITPQVIEQFFINPLVNFLNNAFENNLTVFVSNILMDEFEDTHPWRLSHDPIWKGWISDWYSILRPLLNKTEIVMHPMLDVDGLTCCQGLTSDINKIFNDFLNTFATHTLPNNSNEEAIFTPTPWCYNFDNFITLKNPEQIMLAKYTWYKIYPHNLPCEGEFPFVPPDTWRRSLTPIKGKSPGYGFLDSLNREWIWDRLHDNHWDVQNPEGGRNNYRNVSPEGKVLGKD